MVQVRNAAYLHASYNNITDAKLVIVVSTTILWKVQISTRKKLALAGICSLTALIICISVIRISIGSSGGRLDDASYILLGGIEIAIGKRIPEQMKGRESSEAHIQFLTSYHCLLPCILPGIIHTQGTPQSCSDPGQNHEKARLPSDQGASDSIRNYRRHLRIRQCSS